MLYIVIVINTITEIFNSLEYREALEINSRGRVKWLNLINLFNII